MIGIGPFLLPRDKSIRWISALGFLIGSMLFVYSLQWQLNGPHQHRQADSISPGYYYCTEEDSRFLYPRVGPRGNTDGVAINEFPIYSYFVGQICKIKGSWDEITPRIVSILMALCAGILFWLILLKKYPWASAQVSGQSLIEFLTVFIFLPVNWTFFTIPMPESTALFLNALAGYLWLYFPFSKFMKIVAAIIFCLSFVIRPFYVLLLFFYFPGVIVLTVTLLACVGLFWFWYRYWSGLVTTLPGYFGIQFQSGAQVLASIPRAMAHLPVRLLEHTGFVGIISMIIVWRRQIELLLFYLAAVVMMYVLKSTHIAAHAYYLLNAGVFAAFFIFLSLRFLSLQQRRFFLGFFLIYTFVNTQHNFRSNGHELEMRRALQEYQLRSGHELDSNANVATYLGMTPEWLYYLKRTGFIFEPQEFRGSQSCIQGASHYLIRQWIGPNYDEHAPLFLGQCSVGAQ